MNWPQLQWILVSRWRTDKRQKVSVPSLTYLATLEAQSFKPPNSGHLIYAAT